MKLPANTQVLYVHQFFDKNDRECVELVREKAQLCRTESKQEEPPSSDQHEGVTTINQLYTKKAVQQITASFQQSQQ